MEDESDSLEDEGLLADELERELDRRAAEFTRDPSTAVSWEELKTQR